MKPTTQFIERRKEARIPFNDKVIFTDGQKTSTAYAVNISRGGVFVMSLDPFPIDTQIFLAFCLPSHPTTFCVKGKVAHIVFDRQRCEVENGMGLMFLELDESQKSIMNLHILNQQSAYLELKKLLTSERPAPSEITRCLRKIPTLSPSSDLLSLRYRASRICSIFEPPPDIQVNNDNQTRKTA